MREWSSTFVWCAAACAAAAVTGEARAGNIFSPSDRIWAFDRDGGASDTVPSTAEGPDKLIDGDLAFTKYLNFGKEGSGIIVTATNAAVAKRIGFLTANDTPSRDPTTVKLYGTNDAITSPANSAGKVENWSLIYSGNSGLASDPGRGFDVYVDFPTNTQSFKSYKAVFPTVRDNQTANSMQLTEMQLYTATSGSFFSTDNTIFSPGNAVVPIDEFQSRYPLTTEIPSKVIDGVNTTKYLNFGRTNSGFIDTPARGATVAKSFTIVTGNDAPNRDPASYEIYGTNELVNPIDNGNGDENNWVLIASGPLSLPTARNALSDPVGFENNLAYTSYKIVFPTLRGNDLMQLSEFILSDTAVVVPEPALAGVFAAGLFGLLRRRRGK